MAGPNSDEPEIRSNMGRSRLAPRRPSRVKHNSWFGVLMRSAGSARDCPRGTSTSSSKSAPEQQMTVGVLKPATPTLKRHSGCPGCGLCHGPPFGRYPVERPLGYASGHTPCGCVPVLLLCPLRSNSLRGVFWTALERHAWEYAKASLPIPAPGYGSLGSLCVRGVCFGAARARKYAFGRFAQNACLQSPSAVCH